MRVKEAARDREGLFPGHNDCTSASPPLTVLIRTVPGPEGDDAMGATRLHRVVGNHLYQCVVL